MASRKDKRSPFWETAGLAVTAVLAFGCSLESGSEGTKDDPREVARAARVETYREGIPEFAAEICQKHGTSTSEFGPACQERAEAYLEAVAQLLERAPATWETQVLGLAGICQRQAFRYAQSEYQGRSENDLLVEGLSLAPDCLDSQYDLLKGKAREEGVPVPEDEPR